MTTIQHIRKARNLRQGDLARLSDLSPHDISLVERGQVKFGPRRRRRLAAALELPVEQLFDAGGWALSSEVAANG